MNPRSPQQGNLSQVEPFSMDNKPQGNIVREASNQAIMNNEEHSPPLPPPCQTTTTINTRRSANRRKKVSDITAKFRQAASTIATGQLIQDEYFTLSEAVGALEIMDPKMDSGFLAPGESLEDDYDVLREPRPDEVVAIMDQLLCSEMTWHMGHSLLQTLFTSLYIDRLLWPEPKTLSQARFNRENESVSTNPLLNIVLRAFCLALIKTCDYVHQRITKETFYEEEDFVTDLYNRNLLSHFDLEALEGLLDDAIRQVDDQENLVSKPIQEAIRSRLKLRKAFLHAVAIDVDVNKEEIISAWSACSSLLASLSRSHQHDQPVSKSFSEKIQRKLASASPPRPIVSVDFNTAWEYLRRLCDDGKDVAGVLDCYGGNGILTFTLTIQSRLPQPCVYMRCLLQSLVFNERGILSRMSIKQLVFEDLAEITLPADILIDRTNDDIEIPSSPRFYMAQRMDTFVSRIGHSYLDIFRALSMNRARMRRMLCHVAVDWDNIQMDLEELDIELQPYTNERPIQDDPGASEPMWSFPLSAWAYYHKLVQMEWIVHMGFELQVYQIDELASMYWYLRQLVEIRQQHLTRIYTFSNHRKALIPRLTEQQDSSFDRSFSFLTFASSEALAISAFADSLSSLYKVLFRLRLLAPSSSYPYSNSSLRHALRMAPFLTITVPQVPSEPVYVAAISPLSAHHPAANYPSGPVADQQEVLALLACADAANREAKAEWELVRKTDISIIGVGGDASAWKSRVKDVQKSVIAAGVAIAVVKRWVEGGGEVTGKKLAVEVLSDRKAYHPWWIVPKVSAAVDGKN